MKVELDGGAIAPKRAHKTDAGLDLYSRETAIIPARGSHTFDTGVHVELPHGTAGVVMSKSGLNVKKNLTSTGLIDESYTGAIRVKLYNHGDEPYTVFKGDKISQLVVIPVEYVDVEIVDEIPRNTERGDNGFGSTGTR